MVTRKATYHEYGIVGKPDGPWMEVKKLAATKAFWRMGVMALRRVAEYFGVSAEANDLHTVLKALVEFLLRPVTDKEVLAILEQRLTIDQDQAACPCACII